MQARINWLFEQAFHSPVSNPLRLPGATGDQDEIRAQFEKGILRITVPKVQKPEAKP